MGTEIQRLLSYQDLPRFHGNDGWVLPIPATFVVGRDGLVKARFVDPDFRKRMEIDDLIAALKRARADSLSLLSLVAILRPIGAPQHSHHGGRHRGALASGDAVEVDGAANVKSVRSSLASACCGVETLCGMTATPISASSNSIRSRSDEISWL